MSSNLRVAAIQMNAGLNQTANIETAQRLVVEAVNKGASFVALPEVFNFRGDKALLAGHATSIPGPVTQPFQALAKNYNVDILLGSVIQKIDGQNKLFNTSVLINDDGQIVAQYQKMHLFDVQVDQHQIRESDTFDPGSQPVLVSVKSVPTGLGICYDLRFPELFRHYAAKGAKLLCVPSSFTRQTGTAHWDVLLRARAIENLCFVIAPNQIGVGNGGVQTFGNSLIVDPWGTVLARASADQEEVIVADLDLYAQQMLRSQFPCLAHRVDIR